MKYKDILGYSKPKKKVIKEKVEKPTITEELEKEFGKLNEFEKILTEGRDLDSKHIKKIAKMTDRNNHLGARTYLSYFLKGGNRGKFWRYFNAASEINDVLGGTPSQLSRLNQKIEKDFYRALKNKFGNADEIIGAL